MNSTENAADLEVKKTSKEALKTLEVKYGTIYHSLIMQQDISIAAKPIIAAFLDRGVDHEKIQQILASEVFVEKAQYHLGYRAWWYNFAATALILSAVVAIGTFVFWYGKPLNQQYVDFVNSMKIGSLYYAAFDQVLTGGVFLGGAFALVSLARSFLHEAAVLYARRHALRFGRLQLLLSEGKLDMKEMMEAYGWNIETGTAFERNESERRLKGIIGQVTELVSTLGKVVGDVAKGKSKDPD